MNKELFQSMQEQMTPSSEVRAALSEKLAQPAKKRPVSWRKYGAVAACAVLAVGAVSVYGLRQNHQAWMLITRNFRHDVQVQNLHSYVLVEGLTGDVFESTSATIDIGGGTETGSSEGSDQDMEMTVYDLEEAMLDVGFTEEEVKEYEAIGYQMTWAKWWKFVHEQENSEGDEPFNLDALKTFSQKELSVNTGALPIHIGDVFDGAYICYTYSQEEAVNAYQKLMDRFNGTYPDWYGGAYIDRSGWLVVQLVEDKNPLDKTLELQVLDWAGSDHVMFSSCKYSLAQLNGLMDRLNALPDADMKCGDVMAGWGVDEEHNRIELTLTQVNDHILAVLAEMDPADDMILVQVGQRASVNDAPGEVVTADSARAEDPAAHHVMPGGATVPDVPVPEGDDNLIADEPWVDDLDGAHYGVEELPQPKQPAVAQSVPEEGRFIPAYGPDVGFIYPAQ